MHQETRVNHWPEYRRYWDRHAAKVGAARAVTHMSPKEYLDHYRAVFAALVDLVPFRITDLACGPGLMLPVVRRKWSDPFYVGYDISPKMITAAKVLKDAMPECRFRAYFYVMETPTIPTDCDLLLCHSLFTHIYEPDARLYLDEIYRAIGSGGMATISIHAEKHGGDNWRGKIGRIDYRPDYFESMLAEHGFRVTGIYDSVQRYYGVRHA